MHFDIYNRSLDLLRTLAPLAKLLDSADPELAKQMRRSARNVHLNIAEANRRVGRDRLNRFRWVLAEAAEVTAALDVAVVLEHCTPSEVADALELADRVRAIAYRLAKLPRKR